MFELVLGWILQLPQFYGEVVPREERITQVTPVAIAIAHYAKDPELAAISVSVAWWESKFLERIQAGDCRKPTRGRRGECDWSYKDKEFKARGFFQTHEDASYEARKRWDELLGLEQLNVDATVQVAVNIMRRGRTVCKSVEGAISYYAVGHCRWAFAGPRAATVRKLLGRKPQGDV